MSGDGMQPVLKKPPCDIEAEQSLLGAIMLDNAVFYTASAILGGADDFYREDHRTIWRLIAGMVRARKVVDFVTLGGEAKDQKQLDDVGGLSYLGQLANETPSTVNAHWYAERVREMAQRRRLICYAGDLMERAWSTPVDELTGSITTGLNALLSRSTSTSKRFVEACSDAEASILAAKARRQQGGVVGAPIGLRSVDRLIGGFSGPRLIILAARPKCGKSALLNQFGVHAAVNGWPGLICSLELGAEELAIRAMANAGGVNVTKLHRGYDEELNTALDRTTALGDIPLWIDTETMKLDAILAQAALHKHKHGIKWFAVDHIGLVRTSGRFNSRNDQIGHISWSLKEMAKRLGIPCIALSQLGRDCDKHNRKPRADDLRDSGNLEQDADMVMMLHVPLKDRDEAVKPMRIGVPANRIGPSCWLDNVFEFDGRTQRITETAARADGEDSPGEPPELPPPPDDTRWPYAD